MTENTKDKKHTEDHPKKTDQHNMDEKLAELEQKVTDTENNWKRALADYQNLQKRTTEERLQFVSYSNMTLIRKLLPILDNLEMLQKHLKDEGLKMIIHEYNKILEEEGVSEVEALNKEFDPQIMEAVETVEGEKDKVITVLQKGYFLKDKLIRPARVNVGHGKEKSGN